MRCGAVSEAQVIKTVNSIWCQFAECNKCKWQEIYEISIEYSNKIKKQFWIWGIYAYYARSL